MSDTVVRAATAADAPAINSIYNHYVMHSSATFDEIETSLETRLAWLGSHGGDHPVFVVEREGDVIAWGSLTRWASRRAWRHTVEVSTYVDSRARGTGIGPTLLAELIGSARQRGHHALIAQISADNEPSLRMAARAGFKRVGTLKHVGRKFDRWIDLALLELIIEDPYAATHAEGGLV